MSWKLAYCLITNWWEMFLVIFCSHRMWLLQWSTEDLGIRFVANFLLLLYSSTMNTTEKAPDPSTSVLIRLSPKDSTSSSLA